MQRCPVTFHPPLLNSGMLQKFSLCHSQDVNMGGQWVGCFDYHQYPLFVCFYFRETHPLLSLMCSIPLATSDL